MSIWELVEQVRLSGDISAKAKLYEVVSRLFLPYIRRTIGPVDCRDRLHETFIIAMAAIENGRLQDPKMFIGYVRTVARRIASRPVWGRTSMKFVSVKRAASCADEAPSPEHAAIRKQEAVLAFEALATLPANHRQVISRFYLLEQTREQICTEMQLTERQFGQMKWRAKDAIRRAIPDRKPKRKIQSLDFS